MTKIVCRLLTADHQLLGWCEHRARMRGDGCLRADHAVNLTVTAAGVPRWLSLHWCDANTEVKVLWTGPARVSVGDVVWFFKSDDPMVKIGEMPTNLPPVTVGSVTIAVPTGTLGAKGAVFG